MATRTHPRVTPFHLTFILTTAGLGIAKAVLVSKGDTASSITVEWVTGVVVALIIQFLGSCEYSNARPRYLDWYYNHNCLGTDVINADLPDAGPENGSRGENIGVYLPPLVTGYRLLVSAVFVLFALAKMFCGYLGLSSAMNTLDWMIAVPLTLSVYYIGLYEEQKNKSILSRRLFDISYSAQTTFTLQTVVALAVYFGSISLCYLWLDFWSGILPGVMKFIYQDDGTKSQWWDAICNAVTTQSTRWTAAIFCIAMFEVGILVMGGILWPIIAVISKRYANAIRYYSLLAGFITFYSLFTTFCVGLFLMFFAPAVKMSGKLFIQEGDSYLPVILQFFLSIFAVCITVAWSAVSGFPAGFALVMLPYFVAGFHSFLWQNYGYL